MIPLYTTLYSTSSQGAKRSILFTVLSSTFKVFILISNMGFIVWWKWGRGPGTKLHSIASRYTHWYYNHSKKKNKVQCNSNIFYGLPKACLEAQYSLKSAICSLYLCCSILLYTSFKAKLFSPLSLYIIFTNDLIYPMIGKIANNYDAVWRHKFALSVGEKMLCLKQSLKSSILIN